MFDRWVGTLGAHRASIECRSDRKAQALDLQGIKFQKD